MADGTIIIEYTGDDVMRELRRLQAAVGPAGMRPALAEIGEDLAESTRLRFSSGTAPDGSSWATNSQTTLRRKRGTRPLVDSGMLGGGITYQLVDGGVEIGSSRIYAGTQQMGAKRGQYGRTSRGAPIPWGDIPARPLLGVSAADEQTILGILADHIAG